MEFKDTIKKYRNSKKLSQNRLADIVNVHQTAVSQWEQGKTFPDIETLVRLANYFGITVDDLINSNRENETVKRIPVLGSIPAGIPLEAIEDIIDYEEIPSHWTETGAEYFSLKIKGDSMFPEYRDGDVIIFKKQTTCDNNEDCAVMINGDEATFKRVERNESGIILKPLNPNYESKFYSNIQIESLPIRIIGVFWELRRGRKGQ